MVKGPISIVVYNDETNEMKFVVETLSQILGYHPNQAYQCASLIHERGSYAVKVIPHNGRQKAQIIKAMLIKSGLIAELVQS